MHPGTTRVRTAVPVVIERQHLLREMIPGRRRRWHRDAAVRATRTCQDGDDAENQAQVFHVAARERTTSGRAMAIRISTAPNVQTIVAPVGRSNCTDTYIP